MGSRFGSADPFFVLFFLFGCGCGGLGFLTTVGNVFWVGFCVWGVFWGLFVVGCGLVSRNNGAASNP